MTINKHCEECQKILGCPFRDVHEWLDEYACKYWPFKEHRKHRHHREGIEEVRRIWGDVAALAAELHIISDMGEILTRDQCWIRYNDSSHAYK